MKIDWQEWLTRQDQRIKSAQGDLVKSELRKLNLKSLPCKFAADVANLARRLNQSDLILKLLKRPFQNDREKTLYGLALARIGAYQESQQLLSEVSDEDNSLLLWKASALISQWNYAAALKIYEKLRTRKLASKLEEILVKINQASCLVFLQDFSKAIPILAELESIREDFTLLYANSRELLAQALFGVGNYEMAEQMIQESLALLAPGEADYSLFARKWNLLIRTSMGRSSDQDWIELRQAAAQAQDSETCRDLDWRQACVKKDLRLFWHVYFGTPFECYRQRALGTFPIALLAPKSHLRQALSDSPSPYLMDLVEGDYQSPLGNLKIPEKALRLLRSLARDAYRPIPIGELFATFYPDIHFDVHSSAHRLYQTVQWTRKFLLQHQIPIEIRLQENVYSVQTSTVDFRIALEYPQVRKTQQGLEEIQSWLLQRQTRHFTRQELQDALQISKDHARAWIQAALKQKWVQKQGQGNHIIYHPQLKRLKKPA
jgi:hypothetical protein